MVDSRRTHQWRTWIYHMYARALDGIWHIVPVRHLFSFSSLKGVLSRDLEDPELIAISEEIFGDFCYHKENKQINSIILKSVNLISSRCGKRSKRRRRRRAWPRAHNTRCTVATWKREGPARSASVPTRLHLQRPHPTGSLPLLQLQ